MYRNGRPVLPINDPLESLYLRYFADNFVDGQLQTAAIRFPNQSVNRGSLSEPEDVLFDEQGRYDGLGVVEIMVHEIPETIADANGTQFSFNVSHSPEEKNYSHSEIRSPPPLTGPSKVPSRTAKFKFRHALCRCITSQRVRIVAMRESTQHS